MLSVHLVDRSAPPLSVNFGLCAARVAAAALPLLAMVVAPPAPGPAWWPGLQLLASAAWIHCVAGPLWRRP